MSSHKQYAVVHGSSSGTFQIVSLPSGQPIAEFDDQKRAEKVALLLTRSVQAYNARVYLEGGVANVTDLEFWQNVMNREVLKAEETAAPTRKKKTSKKAAKKKRHPGLPPGAIVLTPTQYEAQKKRKL